MTALGVNKMVDFNALKAYLAVPDGNLANHLKGLEKEDYVDIKKSFISGKPNTSYYMTKKGKEAFEGHINSLENFVKCQNKENIFLSLYFELQSTLY